MAIPILLWISVITARTKLIN